MHASHAGIIVTMLQEDLRLWLPGKDNQETTGKDEKSEKNEKDKGDREDLDLETAHRLLRQVGDQFCDLLHQEKDALQEHMAEGKILLGLKKTHFFLINPFHVFHINILTQMSYVQSINKLHVLIKPRFVKINAINILNVFFFQF